jgi:hypothetical protein
MRTGEALSQHASRRHVPAALAVTWLGSLGTGAATNGVYFVADQRYGFSPLDNLLLGLALGAVYVGGAFSSGPATRLLTRRLGLSQRTSVMLILSLLALSCAVAGWADRGWIVWLFVIVFAPLTGMLWPLVESFLSSGRRGAELRRIAGHFNLAWASAVFAAYLFMKPLLEVNAAMVFWGLAIVHALCVPLVFAFPCSAKPHAEAAHEHDPEERAQYRRLLHCFRLLLVGSYILFSAATPLFPARFTALGVADADRVLYASTWMAARVATFILMQRWHGWHGRRQTVFWAAALMTVGFSALFVVPTAELMLPALALFGIGIGATYAAAFYYAMEVGDAEVDAGATHEGMIGLGYTFGPMAGLVAVGLVQSGTIPPATEPIAVIVCVLLTFGALAAQVTRVALAPPPRA